MPNTTLATPDEPDKPKKTAKPKLRDGVMKRGKTWSYVIRVTNPETGISTPKWVGGFVDEDAAKEARDEARVAARRGEYIDRNAITVGEYLDEWLEAHAVEIKPRTLASYQTMIRLYVKPHIGGLRLQAVRPARITKLYRDLLTGGGDDGKSLSTSTVTRCHAILCKAFRDAVLVDELISSNPAERAKRPRSDLREPGLIWTTDQLRTFLAAVRRHRLFAFFHLAAYSGARRGELLNLRWSSIDMDGKTITITGSTGVIKGQRIEGTTKNGRSRVVSIDDETVSVLREHRKAQAADKLLAGEEWAGGKDGYVFATGRGKPIHPDSVGWIMTKAIRAHNAPGDGTPPLAEPLPHARVHDLRHIHATTLLLNGVPLHVVAARLGHADPAITLRVYAHVVRAAEVSAAAVFAKIMNAAV